MREFVETFGYNHFIGAETTFYDYIIEYFGTKFDKTFFNYAVFASNEYVCKVSVFWVEF